MVYNHFGPEGNYLGSTRRSSSRRHKTSPWGAAINFDGPGSAPVRQFFIHNALHWIRSTASTACAWTPCMRSTMILPVTYLDEICDAVPEGKPQMELDLVGEDIERACDEAGGAVGVLARAAPAHLLHPAGERSELVVLPAGEPHEAAGDRL